MMASIKASNIFNMLSEWMSIQVLRNAVLLDFASIMAILVQRRSFMSAYGTRSTHEVVIAAIAGNRGAQQRFLRDNEALIHKVVRHYAFGHEWMEDLFQEASIGLLKALPKFDVERGLNFSTYALPWMRVYVERFIQANMYIISMPTRTQALAYRIKAMSGSKSSAMIAEDLNISLESVESLIELHGCNSDYDFCPASDDPALLAEQQIDLGKASSSFNKLDKKQQDIVLLALDIHPDYDSVSAYEKHTGVSRAQFNKFSKLAINQLQNACS
jgi:RNA polymerase sigma factor (sigma-70 family)